MLANGPGSVQWNIPLYDDDVLWIVPGSHRRLNTARENQELLNDPRAPLSSCMQVRLKAGDGVMYINTILHWPSNYSTKLRRIIHLRYTSFGGQLYPYGSPLPLGAEFVKHLSAGDKRSSIGLSNWLNARTIGSKRSIARFSTRIRKHSGRLWPCCIQATPGGWSAWSFCRNWLAGSAR